MAVQDFKISEPATSKLTHISSITNQVAWMEDQSPENYRLYEDFVSKQPGNFLL